MAILHMHIATEAPFRGGISTPAVTSLVIHYAPACWIVPYLMGKPLMFQFFQLDMKLGSLKGSSGRD